MPCSGAGRVHQSEFTRQEIAGTVRREGLLAIELELGPSSEFRHPHGFAAREATPVGGLSAEEVHGLVLQARDLGARRITLLGGEPEMDPLLEELVEFVRSQGLEVEVLARGAEAGGDPERCRHRREVASVPPLGTDGCMRHLFSCLVCSCGCVIPCAGLNLPIGSIREQTLSEVLSDSEVLQDLRDHVHTIKGPCASCEDAEICYGCRGEAYRSTGDYLASDPSCPRNANRQQEIARLPFPADTIIPQRKPMRIIDQLVGTGDRSGEVSVTVSEEMPFVGGDGIIDGIAYFEMMAQSVAAMNGFKRLGRSRSPLAGFLVGANDLEVLGLARVGETLTIHLHKETRFGQLGVLRGTVSRGDAVLARGEIKIWQTAGDVPDAATSQ